MVCKVQGCHFPTTHITKAHRCGSCSKTGHGVMECGQHILITKLLEDTSTIPVDMHCCASNCENNTEHTTSGHYCVSCKQYSHDISECPDYLWKIKVESGTCFGQLQSGFTDKKKLQLLAKNQMKWEEHKVYTKIYGGMGCTWYARRSNNFKKIKLFFLHSDNWGQYGPSTDHRPNLNLFLEGFRCIDKQE